MTKCIVCNGVYGKDIHSIGVITDNVKTITLCRGCFTKVFADLMGSLETIYKGYYRYKTLFPNDEMTLARYTRSMFIDRVLEEVQERLNNEGRGKLIDIMV